MKECKYCGSEITSKYGKLFCSQSCSAKFNNRAYPKKAKAKQCPSCGKSIVRTSTYCIGCYRPNVRAGRVAQWKAGEWAGGIGGNLSTTIRGYLLAEAGFKCSKCSVQLFHPIDGKTVLEINHIDGNGSNHRPDNLEVLCPNCHAMTDTYRARNWGKGRTDRLGGRKVDVSTMLA